LQRDVKQAILKITPDGNVSTAVAWRGDVPVRLSARRSNPARISTRALLRFGQKTLYARGTPQIVIETPSYVDATASVTQWTSKCPLIFEIANAESLKPELSERRTEPSLRVAGELKPGLYNLTLSTSTDSPPCVKPGLGGIDVVLQFVVTVTSN